MDQATQNIIKNIIDREIYFHFSHSGGHGGQNVNKRETKAELYFNIHDSKNLSPEQKERLILLGAHRVHHHEGILIMTCQEERMQNANKQKVIHHFTQLMEEVLTPPKQRIATNIPYQIKEQRITEKKIQSKKKKNREIKENDY